jgi:hypothetical protein
MFTKQSSFLLMLLFWGYAAQAQQRDYQREYQPGYIVRMPGDTLYGQVRYAENGQETHSCCYRVDSKAPVACFQPHELTGYGFASGRIFESMLVDGALVFAQVLVKGKATLLKTNGRYFIQKSQDQPVELISRDTTFTRKGYTYRLPTREFANLLRNTLMADCPAVESSLARARLQDLALIRVFEVYNRCRDEDAARPTRSAEAKIKVAAGLGLNWGRSTLGLPGGELLNNQTDLNPTQPFIPMPSLRLLLWRPGLSQRFALQTGMDYLYETFQYKSYQVIRNNPGDYETEKQNLYIQMESLRVPLLFRYNFMGSKLTPYVAVGSSFIIGLDSDSNCTVEKQRNKVVNTYNFPFFKSTGMAIALAGTAGVSFPLFGKWKGFVDGRYERPVQGIAKAHEFDPNQYPNALRRSSLSYAPYHSVQFSVGIIYR